MDPVAACMKVPVSESHSVHEASKPTEYDSAISKARHVINGGDNHTEITEHDEGSCKVGNPDASLWEILGAE